MTTDPGSIRPKSTHPNSTLRAPTREDLYRGGRSLLALLDGMAEQELQGCRFDVLRNRMEMVMIRADGTETPGWGWPVMEALGAVQGSASSRPRLLPRSNRPLARNRFELLRNLNLDPDSRSIAPGFGEMDFVIDGRWGLLPSAIPALHCSCAVLPGPDIRASLQVISEDAAQADRQAAREAIFDPPTLCWRIPS